VNAIVLGGGSAYGLNAAHGVMTRLAALRRGVRVGSDESQVVPIVPAAILYDLGRVGVFGNYPGPDAGAVAFDDAMAAAPGAPFPLGGVGAGTGALAGGLKGGVGSASVVLAGPALSPSAPSPPALGRPVTVAALAVVNSAGAVADERSGILHGARFGLPGEFDWLVPPSPEEQLAGAGRVALPARGGEPEPLNTTIGVVATDASLTKAQCAKLAGVAHDGMARAIRPAHSMFDGDTVFALATGDGPGPSPLELHAILTAAADCFTRAVVHAVLSATSVTAKNRTWPGYLDLYPSADTRLPRMPRTPLPAIGALMDYGTLFRLDGRTAVVVGAARGLASVGATVICADINEPTAVETAGSVTGSSAGAATAYHLDARDPAAVARTAAEFAGAEILVFTTGTAGSSSTMAVSAGRAMTRSPRAGQSANADNRAGGALLDSRAGRAAGNRAAGPPRWRGAGPAAARPGRGPDPRDGRGGHRCAGRLACPAGRPGAGRPAGRGRRQAGQRRPRPRGRRPPGPAGRLRDLADRGPAASGRGAGARRR